MAAGVRVGGTGMEIREGVSVLKNSLSGVFPLQRTRSVCWGKKGSLGASFLSRVVEMEADCAGLGKAIKFF